MKNGQPKTRAMLVLRSSRQLVLADGLATSMVAAVELKTGPVCLSQSEPVQPLIYYRLVRQPSA
jgi:hypothetical protein